MYVYILSLAIPRMRVKITHHTSILINNKHGGIVSCHELLGVCSEFLTKNELLMTNDERSITAN